MNIIKKIAIYFLCSFILLYQSYCANTDNPTHQELLEKLPMQEQIDALHFYTSYLKINSRVPGFGVGSPQGTSIENMAQWRESLFTYTENLVPTKRALFFCCVYYHINPLSNIMSCAPPSVITDFKIRLIRNAISRDDTSGILSACLTYGRIRTVRIIL